METASIERQWFSYPEAERFSGLSRTTLWRLVSSGQVRAAKIGRATRIDRHSLQAFMEHHASQPKPPGFEEADR